MKKSVTYIGYTLVIVLFACLITYIIFPDEVKDITGRVAASLSLFIEGLTISINIHSPLNVTYNFGIGSPYILSLNVSSDYNVTIWRYRLDDVRHGVNVNQSVTFTPNTTIVAVRWNNRLTVFANDSNGNTINESVEFFVSVPSTAPLLSNISSNIYMCENQALDYTVNATDPDEETLTLSISPQDPFFITPTSFSGQTNISASIFSGTLGKQRVGTYAEAISIEDGQYADTKYTNITVIEINNIPTFQNIGVQTVWTQGENSTFLKQAIVTDTENGNSTSGNFTFNLTFLTGTRFFNVSNLGVMNVTPNVSLIGVYNLSLCVVDKAINSIHPNISLCGQTGLNNTVCRNFSLTVTNENRAPRFNSYFPTNLTFTTSGTTSIAYNISKSDPDGTAPDAYWYVDDIFREYDSGGSVDTFVYAFSCGVSGTHRVRVDITDGLLNNSLQWNVSVNLVDCPIESSGGGGGGGSSGTGPVLCKEQWICYTWDVCRNTKDSLLRGIISGGDYDNITAQCNGMFLNDEKCGFQLRSCIDIASCNSTKTKPSELQSCHYVFNPSCSDNVKNCHDGDCEVLTDCGGPCNACNTCSDGISNQEEDGIDCGGPCPILCKDKSPFKFNMAILKYLGYGSLALLLIILIVLIVKLIRKMIKMRKDRALAWYKL